MSEQNIEIVRAIYDAFARGDTESPFRFYASDVEWDVSRGALEGGRHHYAVWTLNGGTITRMRVYLDRAEALEATGAPGA